MTQLSFLARFGLAACCMTLTASAAFGQEAAIRKNLA